MHAGRKRGICYNAARSGSFIASHITSILLERGSGTFPFLKTLSFSLSLSPTPSDGLLKKKHLYRLCNPMEYSNISV